MELFHYVLQVSKLIKKLYHLFNGYYYSKRELKFDFFLNITFEKLKKDNYKFHSTEIIEDMQREIA